MEAQVQFQGGQCGICEDSCGYMEVIQDVISVIAAYYDLRGVCAVHCVRVYAPYYNL